MGLRRWLCAVACVLAVMLVVPRDAAAQSVRADAGRAATRPSALVPLYISFTALQALDAHSTLTAIGTGARETNPVVRSAMTMPAGMVALKAGTAVGVVYLTEKLWKRNRTAAVLTMIALNSAYATIAAHNYAAAGRRLR